MKITPRQRYKDSSMPVRLEISPEQFAAADDLAFGSRN